MKNDKRLNITSVTSITRKLCDYTEGEQHNIVTAGVKLMDNGELKEYLTFLVCPVDEISDVLDMIESMNGMAKEDYIIPSKYCHITTFENNMHSRSQITFDENDDFPVKANINSEYQYVNVFFDRFFQYRNQLVGNDIEQYFDSIARNMQLRNSKQKRFIR